MKPARLSGIPSWFSYGMLYFLCAYILTWLAREASILSPVWLATGVALAAVLLHGYRVLPGICLGGFLALYLNDMSVLGSGILACGSIAGVAIAAYLLRTGPIHKLLLDTRQLLYFLLIGPLIPPLFNILSKAGALYFEGTSIARTTVERGADWWIADATGIILIAPLLLAWFTCSGNPTAKRPLESLLLAMTAVATCFLMFGGLLPDRYQSYPTTYLFFPVLAWAFLRFHQRATTLLLLLLACIAIWSGYSGFGPFSQSQMDDSILPLQIYIIVVCVTGLYASAVVSERRQTMQRMALANKIITHSPEGMIVTDPGGIILSANPAFFESTGFHPGEITGRSIRKLTSVHHNSDFFTSIWRQLKLNGHWEGEIWNRNREGEILPQWLSLTAISDSTQQPSHYLGIYSNVSRQKQVQERIHRLAYYDVLTNLPNRQLFTDRLGQALKYASRKSSRLALLFIDLDRFKNINDTLGHSVGDKVLQLTAERLTRCIRQTDTLARLGGDEFTIIIQDVKEDFDTILVAEKTVKAFQSPIVVDDHELFLTPSIGVALFPDDAGTSEELIKFADTAMYRAKELGGNGFQFFAADMSDPIRWNLTIENALRRAIEQDNISLVYQPQFDLRSGNIIGLEALARWHHKGLEETPPGVFVKVAEETGLIHRMGEQILEMACRQTAFWKKEGFNNLKVSINISLLQLKQSDFSERLHRIVEETGAPLDLIELEITESTLMENAGFMENLINMLSVQGFHISIDDFGTGYSSLSYLKRLAIDRIKIDGSFINDLPDDSNDAAICSAIISMAHSLNLQVIAEGVETDEQMEYLKKERCDEIQGYIFSRPVGPQEISEMIHQGYWHTE